MHRRYLPALLLACMLVLSGCLGRGNVRPPDPPPVCPRLQPIPELSQPRIDYVKKVQDELFGPLPSSKQKGIEP